MTMQSPPRAFPALDGLRGIAALAVAARHAPYLWADGYPAGFLHQTYLAVDFFFVLSGFVLCHAYGQRFQAGLPVRSFMLGRLVRLYPLYFTAFVLACAIAVIRLVRAKVTPFEFAGNLTAGVLFLPSPLSATDLFPMNLPAWSLFFELVANLAFALIGRRLTMRVTGMITAGGAVVLLAAVPMGWLGFGSVDGPLDAGPTWQSMGGGLARVTFSFFAGVLMYRLRSVWTPRLAVPAWLALAAVCAILAGAPEKAWEVAYDLTAVLVAFPLIVFFGATSRLRPIAARAASAMGDASYAIYVLQFPLFGLLPPAFAVLLGYKPPEISLGFGLACVALVAIVGWAADRVIDRPVRSKLSAMLRRPRQSAMPGLEPRLYPRA